MPKEVTHWIITDKVAQKLEGSRWQPILEQFPNIYKLGAVFHDKIYYLSVKTKIDNPRIQEKINAIPSRLHGIDGEDTHEIIAALLKSIDEEKGNANHLKALLAGVATHIYADITWHPFVYYFTGDYNDPNPNQLFWAQHDHRKIEALMDLYFAGGYKPIREKYYLGKFISKLRYPLDSLCEQAGRHFSDLPEKVFGSYYVQAVREAIYGHQWMRKLAINSQLFYLQKTLPRKVRLLYSALYNQQLKNFLPRFEKEIMFKNPVTGEEQMIKMNAYLEESVDNCVRFLHSIEDWIFGTQKGALPSVGHSLEHGMPPGKVYEMTYFDFFFERR